LSLDPGISDIPGGLQTLAKGSKNHEDKTRASIGFIVAIILVTYSLFFIFQISTELNARAMILKESTRQQEALVLQIAGDLAAANGGADTVLQMSEIVSNPIPFAYDDRIGNIGMIDEAGVYVWNSDPIFIDSKFMSPDEIFLQAGENKDAPNQAEEVQAKSRLTSIVHRIDGSEYLTSIIPVPYSDPENKLQDNQPMERRDGHTLYVVISTPLAVFLDEINDILFGQRIQTFSLVAGISLITVLMTFFLQRSIRLKSEANNHVAKLEESNRLIMTQQTAMAQANNELKKLDELKDNFISIASHELKNPIQPILLCSELAKKGAMDKDKALDIVLTNARRLRQLSTDILDVSKIDSGNFTCILGRVRINEMVSELVKSAALVGNPNLKLEISIDQDIEIDGDKVRLFQVFSNLIGNAVKFTVEGCVRIETKTFPDRNMVEVSVSDTGTGIPDEMLPTLFNKFVSYSADQRNRHGSGLGLYIAKAIVDAHRGQISAQNNITGRGATFTVSLPIRHPEDVAISALPQGTQHNRRP